MANKIILNQQTFSFQELADKLPQDEKKTKIFFQAELQSLENGDARFGINAYVACWENGRWNVCEPVRGRENGAGNTLEFTPFSLGNNELVLATGKKKKKNKKKKKKESQEFRELFRKVVSDPELAKIAVFHCSTGISKNPHLTYDVTLEAGGSSARTITNPSPPENPEY